MKLIVPLLSLIILPAFIFTSGILNQAKPEGIPSVSQLADENVLALTSGANSTVAVSAPVAQPTSASSFITLANFTASLANGQPGQVVGVYVPNVLSLKVTQQPKNNPAYVNETLGEVTQFDLAQQYGSTGLLAHNHLSGVLFSTLSIGQEVDIIYGDGSVRRYSISLVRHFQALSPLSTHSNFVDLDNPANTQISNADLFYQIYNQGDRVVFQTCITRDGNTSWGRLFVIATPIL